MRKCKWCRRKYNPKQQAHAFCDYNPNREKNVKRYFSDPKSFPSVRKRVRESLRGLARGPVLVVPPSPFRGEKQ